MNTITAYLLNPDLYKSLFTCEDQFMQNGPCKQNLKFWKFTWFPRSSDPCRKIYWELKDNFNCPTCRQSPFFQDGTPIQWTYAHSCKQPGKSTIDGSCVAHPFSMRLKLLRQPWQVGKASTSARVDRQTRQRYHFMCRV